MTAMLKGRLASGANSGSWREFQLGSIETPEEVEAKKCFKVSKKQPETQDPVASVNSFDVNSAQKSSVEPPFTRQKASLSHAIPRRLQT